MEQTDSIKLMFKSITAQHLEFSESIRKFDLELCDIDADKGVPHTVEEIRQFLKEELIDTSRERKANISALRHTHGGAFGS